MGGGGGQAGRPILRLGIAGLGSAAVYFGITNLGQQPLPVHFQGATGLE